MGSHAASGSWSVTDEKLKSHVHVLISFKDATTQCTYTKKFVLISALIASHYVCTYMCTILHCASGLCALNQQTQLYMYVITLTSHATRQWYDWPSSTGFDCSSCSLTRSMSRPLPDTAATYCMITLLASVTSQTSVKWCDDQNYIHVQL